MALVRRPAAHDDAVMASIQIEPECFAGTSQAGEINMIASLKPTQSELAKNLAPAASLERVSKNYGDVPALRNVDFAVRAGEVVALLGPNGAGKTTAVKLLLGLMPPNAGKVRVLGGDP